MRKDFRKKLCVYCATEISQTEDHIFARKFFLERDRGDLPKAPACNKCNGLKAALEDYCLCVLPFASPHETGLEVLQTLVPRRLQHEKKQGLRRSLHDGQGQIWVQEGANAVVEPRMTIPVDSQKVADLIGYIVRGLVWFHWKGYLTFPASVKVFTFKAEGERRYKDVMRQFAVANAECVREDVKNGIFQYEGLRVPQIPDGFSNPIGGLSLKPDMTLWRIRPLGGVCIASGNPDDGVCGSFSAVTCAMVACSAGFSPPAQLTG